MIEIPNFYFPIGYIIIGLISAFIFWAFTDVGGWSEGGCCHQHNIMSFFLGLLWVIILPFFIFIWVVEIICPGLLPAPEKILPAPEKNVEEVRK
ncbi:MAG TPA: hypothetical protein VJ912_04300 [Candidatus Nanoarchaeia archaeon]|nr:hypothetical protein [Candidatus Nanoarchaeia archaeon]